MIFSRCLAYICLLMTLTAQTPGALSSTTVIETDLNRDRVRERIVLNAENDSVLSIWRGRKLLWQGVTKRWKPWKLMVADVDGDGKKEIALGIYKSTRYIPKPHNCLFLYDWNGREAVPKWLGSTLSRPFTDFLFADLDHDGRDNLIAIEITREGKQTVAVYSWNGFGFTLDWQRGAWAKARLFVDERGEVMVEADGERIILKDEKR